MSVRVALVLPLVACTFVLAQETQEEPAKPSAAQIVSQMIAKYHKADSLSGTIEMRQRLGDKSVGIDTYIQFERPSKLYIHQKMVGGGNREWVVSSDGELFSYEVPEDQPFARKGSRLVENVVISGVVLTVRDIYGAAIRSLGDRSTVLDLLIGRTSDLQMRRAQWISLLYGDMVEFEGKKVHRIAGDWRLNERVQDVGRFEMLISPEFDLKRMVIQERLAASDASNPVFITTEWNMNIRVGSPGNPTLYRLVR
jgi:outer membrane lipoprotein-sorting protein